MITLFSIIIYLAAMFLCLGIGYAIGVDRTHKKYIDRSANRLAELRGVRQ